MEYDKDKPLEPGYKRDKNGRPKKKFGTKVKEFFKGKKRVEKERLEREGKLHADGDHPVEKKEVKEKVKDDGTHKVEEVKKIENSPADKANKIDETHKVEKEIKPDGTEKVKESHDIDNGSKGAGNKVDEHHSVKGNQAADGDRKIDETHKVDQHDNGGKLKEERRVREDVDRHGDRLVDETHKIQGDNVPKQVEKDRYIAGNAAGDLGPKGQVGGPHMYGLHEGGGHSLPGQQQHLQQNLTDQRPIQYTNSQAHGIHAGQQVPIAGGTNIAGIQQPQLQQPGQFLPSQQFSTLPGHQGLQQEHVMTHHLGDFIRAGGPKAAAAALQQSHHQMNVAPLAGQGAQFAQPGLVQQPLDAAQQIQMAHSTNLAAQDSTLHMHGGHMQAPQFNLQQNAANLAALQRNANLAAGVPYYPSEQPHHYNQDHPVHHLKDGELLDRPLDAAPTTEFRGTGPAFDPNKLPLTAEQQKLQQQQHARQAVHQDEKGSQEIKKETVQKTTDGGKEKHVEKQEVKPDGQGGAVAKKESVHEQKGGNVPDQKVKETEKVVKKADHVATGTKHTTPAEETKEVQFMERTPGHVETPKEKK